MTTAPVNLKTDVAAISAHWSPHHILTINSSHSFKLAKFQGEFTWHSHPQTDEVFYCVSGGPLRIEISTQAQSPEDAERLGPDEIVQVNLGDLFLIPRGVQHRPTAKTETGVLLIEKVGTVNTGDREGSARTVLVDEGLR